MEANTIKGNFLKFLEHYLEKPRGYHGDWSATGGPKGKTRGSAGPKGFWLPDLPRHSIHHDTPKAHPYNVIISASRTSKKGFL